MAAAASMPAALAATYQLRRGNGGDMHWRAALWRQHRRWHRRRRHCWRRHRWPHATPCTTLSTGWRHQERVTQVMLQVPTTQHPRADHHAFLHTFRTFVQFLDQSCPFSPGTATAARRTRLTRNTWACAVSSSLSRIRARNPRFPPTEVDARSSSCVVHVFEGSCTESCPCVNRDNDQCPGVCPTRPRESRTGRVTTRFQLDIPLSPALNSYIRRLYLRRLR